MTLNPVGDNEEFSAVYWSAMTNAHNLEVVKSGCAPSAGAGSFDVDIASGTIIAGTANGEVAVGADTVTLTSPHATLNRVDIITANSAGNVAATDGTAAADPAAPDIPSGEVLLCAVEVPANASSIGASEIHDYRVLYYGDYPLDASDINDGAGSLLDADTLDGVQLSNVPQGATSESNPAHDEDTWLQNSSGAAEIHYITGSLAVSAADSFRILINSTNAINGSEIEVFDVDTAYSGGSAAVTVEVPCTVIVPTGWYVMFDVTEGTPTVKEWVVMNFAD